MYWLQSLWSSSVFKDIFMSVENDFINLADKAAILVFINNALSKVLFGYRQTDRYFIDRKEKSLQTYLS